MAQAVAEGPGRVTGEPLGIAGAGGDFAVQRAGGLGDDKRATRSPTK